MLKTNEYGAACLATMGAGKSLITVTLASALQLNSDHPVKILCVGPAAAVGVWPREFRLHASDDIGFKVVPLVHPKGNGRSISVPKKKELAQAALEEYKDDPLVIAVNYESVWRDPLGPFLAKHKWDFVIVDEMHRLQNPYAKISKWMYGKLAPMAERRLGLTGTEIGSKGPVGIYAPYRFLNERVFGADPKAFEGRYVETDRWGNAVRFINEEELSQKIESIAFRASAESLKLPSLHQVNVYCDLNTELKKVYKEIRYSEDASLIGLSEEEAQLVQIKGHLPKQLRLAQVSSGFISGVTEGEELFLPPDLRVKTTKYFDESKNPKLIALQEILESIGKDEPIVIFCRFRPEIKMIRKMCEGMGYSVGEISGSLKDGLTSDSTMSQDHDIVIGQIASAGTGVDLTRARYGIYFSKDWSTHNYEQSIKRLHRQGQKHSVTLYHIIVEGTGVDDAIDMQCEASLKMKIDIAEFYRRKGLAYNVTREELETISDG